MGGVSHILPIVVFPCVHDMGQKKCITSYNNIFNFDYDHSTVSGSEVTTIVQNCNPFQRAVVGGCDYDLEMEFQIKMGRRCFRNTVVSLCQAYYELKKLLE